MADSSQLTVNKETGLSNRIVSKLQLQERSLSIVELLLRLLTNVKNLFHKNIDRESDDGMDRRLDNLSADLNELSDSLKNPGHDTAGGALVKAILESILHKHSINEGHKSDHETDDDAQKLAKFIKEKPAELDELRGIVSSLIQFLKLKVFSPHKESFTFSDANPSSRVGKEFDHVLTHCFQDIQLLPVDPGDSSLKITEINKTIIPAVLTRLELAKTYSLFQNPSDKYQSTPKQVKMLTADLGYIISFLTKLEDKSLTLIRNFVEAILRHSNFDNLGTGCKDEAKQLQAKLRVLRKVVVKLKRQISPETELLLIDSDENWYAQVRREFVLDMLPVLHLDEQFLKSPAFRGFRQDYESLEIRTKMCLLCFAAIPENEVVKKSFMTHWWEGEGFVSQHPEKTYQEAADGIFQELVKKNCIEPVNEKHRFTVNRYKMDPFIRTAVIMLAKEAGFFDFDDTGNPSANFKRSYRACLVEGCFQKSLNELDPEKLQVLFNVNVPYPDYVFKFKGFSKLKNVKVLYLGRWQSSANHYIEVESTKFLAGLKSMKLLRFLSLQGISRIRELPRSVCKLPHLRILDLRACHNLEALPDWIGSIRTLTHLDISECYLLHYIPEGLVTLSKLQVLKGFLISKNSDKNSCTLRHLSKLKNLRKLSIYVKMKDFPKAEDVNTLQMFEALQELTITWAVGGPKPDKNDGDNREQDTAAIKDFVKLEKLDLKCYPRTTAPSWLWPRNLPNLKKLYISGGNLQNLSTPVQENNKWPKVEELRLKFLSDLKMDWKKLRSLFPCLTYLEQFKCPKLTYFPSTENGVVRQEQ